MLRPIPATLLRDLVTIKVCIGVDAWQKATWQECTVSQVHIQNTNEMAPGPPRCLTMTA